MIPLAVPNLDGNERKYLNECIDSTFVSSVGGFVDRFEQDLCTETGAAHAVAVNSGTSALHAALVAVGVERDDLVILPNLTFIASANSIAYTGASPWLVDVDENWLLCPEKLSEALESKTEIRDGEVFHKETNRRVKCIMPVYTLGCPANMDSLNKIAKKYSLPVVADAAAAIGATYKNNKIGNLATLTCFSFNGNKTITTGGGGAIVGNNSETMKHLKHITTTARVGTDYIHDEIGYNYRLTNIEAALGVAQLERLASFLKSKKQIRKSYDAFAQAYDGVSEFPSPRFGESANWFSGLVLSGKSKAEVDDVIKALNARGVGAKPFWVPISMQPKFQNCPKENVSFSEKIWTQILTLPCSTSLTEKEVAFVLDQVKKVLG